jgi:hypothetical protein
LVESSAVGAIRWRQKKYVRNSEKFSVQLKDAEVGGVAQSRFVATVSASESP